MVTAADGTAFTGAVTVVVTVDGGTQGAQGGTDAHEGNGFHTYLPTQAETNGDHIAFTFTGTGAVPVTVQVYPSFPQTGDSFAQIGAAGAGLTAINLPNQTMDIVGNITGNVSGSVGSVTGAVGSVTGTVGANIIQINGMTGGVTALDRSTRTIVMGTVGAASSTTSIVTSSLAPAAAIIDQFKGRIVIFDEDTTTTNLRGQATDITANTAAGILTVTELTTAPVSGDSFVIV